MSKDLREKFVSLMGKCSKFNTAFPSLCGLPINELGILHVIAETNTEDFQEGCSLNVQSIQERLQISKPAISYNLNMLEKKEYIVREIDQNDRRRISVHMTQKGTDAWKSSVRRHEDMWDEVVEAFGESNLEQLTKLLSRFFESIDNILERNSDSSQEG